MRKVCLFSIVSVLFVSINSQALVPSAHYQFQYKVNLELSKANSPLRLWIPRPLEDQYQKINKMVVDSPLPWKLSKEKTYGNQVLYFEGTPNQKSVEVTVSFDITRLQSLGVPKEDVRSGTESDPKLYLKADKKVPFVDTIRKIAADETKPSQSDDEKIRSLFEYVVKTMVYDKSGTGWGNGDAVWACTNKRGNCTDFHSLFIALSRSLGIPARFYIGFSVPQEKSEGEIPGYHCWAEAYSSTKGWIPLDATEAKKTGKPNEYYAKLPPNRIEFTMGRDITLSPPQKGEPLNYFIYPYAEVDGKYFEGIKREFKFKRL